jgi:urease accessory protein
MEVSMISKTAVFPLLTTTATICFASTAAFAHPGLSQHPGLALGFMHPLTGPDHILAMVAIGVVAATLGGRALWTLPLASLAAITLGGGLSIAGIKLPLAETMIALSVVAAGVALALPRKYPLMVATLTVSAFALFHGHAHGADFAPTMSVMLFALGFIIATALLHALGIGLAFATAWLPSTRARDANCAVGFAVAIFGIVQLATAV